VNHCRVYGGNQLGANELAKDCARLFREIPSLVKRVNLVLVQIALRNLPVLAIVHFGGGRSAPKE
jgi:hypothetical protein